MHIFTRIGCVYILINNLDASTGPATKTTFGKCRSFFSRLFQESHSSPPPLSVNLQGTAVNEQYERMPENFIRESYENPQAGLKYEEYEGDENEYEGFNCGTLWCRKIQTRKDGHCFYHAMTLSVYYGKYKRRNVPTAEKIMKEMVKQLLSDVVQTFNEVVVYVPGASDLRWVDLSKFDTAIESCRKMGVNEKALAIYATLPRHEPVVSKIAQFVDLVCRYPDISDHRLSHAISLFRALTYIPGIDEIRDIRGRSKEKTAVLTGTQICVVHDESHSNGLDCTGPPNPPQRLISERAEISYDHDPKLIDAYAQLVGRRVRCGIQVCTVLAQENRQFSYLQAVHTSSKHTEIELHLSADDQIDTWFKTAANRIFKDTHSFNKALTLYATLITHSESKDLVKYTVDYYKDVLEIYHMDYFLRELKVLVKIGEDVESEIRSQLGRDDNLSRHLLFSIYCYYSGLGVFMPTEELINRYVKISLNFGIRQCLFKERRPSQSSENVVECPTENVVTREGAESHIVPSVSILSTIFRLEHARQPIVHYFGLRCNS